MKNYLILFAIICFATLSCKKIKERKFVGTYEGVYEYREHQSVYCNFELYKTVDIDSSVIQTRKVYREGDYIYAEGSSLFINISEIDKDYIHLLQAGGSSQRSLRIQDDNLAIRYSYRYVDPCVNYNKSEVFIGVRIQ